MQEQPNPYQAPQGELSPARQPKPSVASSAFRQGIGILALALLTVATVLGGIRESFFPESGALQHIAGGAFFTGTLLLLIAGTAILLSRFH